MRQLHVLRQSVLSQLRFPLSWVWFESLLENVNWEMGILNREQNRTTQLLTHSHDLSVSRACVREMYWALFRMRRVQKHKNHQWKRQFLCQHTFSRAGDDSRKLPLIMSCSFYSDKSLEIGKSRSCSLTKHNFSKTIGRWVKVMSFQERQKVDTWEGHNISGRVGSVSSVNKQVGFASGCEGEISRLPFSCQKVLWCFCLSLRPLSQHCHVSSHS